MSLIHVNKMNLSIDDIAKITGGYLIHSSSQIIKNISLDSREIEEGTLFIAIKGERFDGHDYIGKAFADGAACIIAERIPDSISGNVIIVDSTLAAFASIARYHREHVNPFTVGVTGSVGKTTTKQFIYAVLSKRFHTHKTDGNFNNEIGLPLTILKMEKDTEALVLEMGMSFKGEISRLTKTAQPDIAVITNIGSSHIENLGSREGIRDAKMEIVEGLREGGKLILNADEPLLSGVDNAIYVGIDNNNAAYHAENIVEDCGGITFDIVHPEGICHGVRINTFGRHNVLNASFAYAVGKLSNMTDEEILSGLLDFENAAMRQNIYEFNGMNFIEDCYNASPESMKAALGVLATTAKISGGRKIAVLGNMLELGSYSREMHKSIGSAVFANGIDKLFCFGADACCIGEGAIECGMNADSVISIADIASEAGLGNELKAELKDGDNVLFKASRGVKLERVIEYLKN